MLTEQLAALAPWHFDIDLGDGVSTLDGNKARYGKQANWPVGTVSAQEIHGLMRRIYPKGLKGKRFLDVACNGGGYSVYAKQAGAAYALGFDVRQHWIDQARFVAGRLNLKGLDFKVMDVADFSAPEPFDISLFKGIFYHLPDPIAVLKRVADATREVIIVDTETGGERGEMAMTLKIEDQERYMTGVDGIAWWPSGPDLITRLLEWMGFETREISWHARRNSLGDKAGRCRVIGSRNPAILQRVPTGLRDRKAKRKKANAIGEGAG